MLDAMGDKEGFDKAALTLKNRQSALNSFASSTGRTNRVDRTQVFGYNRSVAGKVTQSAKRQETALRAAEAAKEAAARERAIKAAAKEAAKEAARAAEEQFHAAINGTVTSDGISVMPTVHLYQQAVKRGVSSDAIINSLTSPLDIKPVKYDSQNRPSKHYVGEFATTAVNPNNGNATSCWPTHAKTVRKLKRRKE